METNKWNEQLAAHHHRIDKFTWIYLLVWCTVSLIYIQLYTNVIILLLRYICIGRGKNIFRRGKQYFFCGLYTRGYPSRTKRATDRPWLGIDETKRSILYRELSVAFAQNFACLTTIYCLAVAIHVSVYVCVHCACIECLHVLLCVFATVGRQRWSMLVKSHSLFENWTLRLLNSDLLQRLVGVLSSFEFGVWIWLIDRGTPALNISKIFVRSILL